MALKPVLKRKVDELFLRWLSDPETQRLLKANLQEILDGEPVTHTLNTSIVNNNNSLRKPKPQSPRLRAGSPSTPPCSPSITSPRSPRRNKPFFSRQFNKQLTKEPTDKPEPLRGIPDGLTNDDNTFLRQKQREKRERELRQKENAQQNHDQNADKAAITTTQKPLVPVTTGFSGVPSGDGIVSDAVEGIRKKDGLIAKTISQLKTQQLQPSPKSHGPIIVDQLPSHDQLSPSQQQQQDEASTGVPKTTVNSVETTQLDTKQSNSAKLLKDIPHKTSESAVSRLADNQKDVDRVSKDRKSDVRPSGRNVIIPQFYFPTGQPSIPDDMEATALKIKDAFLQVEDGKVHRSEMGPIAKAAGFPFYWKCPLFLYSGGEKNGHITLQTFLAAWKKLVSSHHDDVLRFMRIITTGNKSYVDEEDLLPLVQDVVDTHPGLTFLQDAPEFHSRYVQTVISRIFYSVNRSWSGKITIAEMRRSNFIQTLQLLEEEEDINQVMDFFSYEHFYVIHCKFWELDKDHDLYISQEDLARHNEHALSMRIIDRIFSGTVARNMVDGKMSYKDFVWFLISEEDKKHPTSIEYWFRCMDLDGDGVISMYEMEYFYEEQVQKMEALGIETLPFEDCLCQMLDMIKPVNSGFIALRDLKACKLTPIFYDTFFNLEKYLEHEQKDPFASLRDGEEDDMSDWERYAAEEYEILVAEEGANEEINYEDDFEPEMEQLSQNEAGNNEDEVIQMSEQRRALAGGRLSNTAEDIYDVTDKDTSNVTY